jgi:hypothetical protein
MIRGIEREQRAYHGVATFEGGQKVSRGQRFAARDSMLVGENDPHRRYPVTLDRVANRLNTLFLR